MIQAALYAVIKEYFISINCKACRNCIFSLALCKNSGLTPYIYLKAGILKREGSGSFGKAAGNMPPAFLFFFIFPLCD